MERPPGRLWAAILAVLVLAALNPRQLFDNEDAVATPLGVKNVGCGDLEPLWLMAQSVPSASLIPCLQLVPVDWTVAKVAVNNGRSVITLDHDRGAKAAMVVRLSASCDLAGATEVTSEQPGHAAFSASTPTARSSRPPAPTPSPGLCHPALPRGRAQCVTAERHGLHRVWVHLPRGAAPGAQPALPRATGAGPLARTMSRQECRSLDQSSEGLL